MVGKDQEGTCFEMREVMRKNQKFQKVLEMRKELYGQNLGSVFDESKVKDVRKEGKRVTVGPLSYMRYSNAVKKGEKNTCSDPNCAFQNQYHVDCRIQTKFKGTKDSQFPMYVPKKTESLKQTEQQQRLKYGRNIKPKSPQNRQD